MSLLAPGPEIGWRAAFTGRGENLAPGIPSVANVRMHGGMLVIRAHVGGNYNVSETWQVEHSDRNAPDCWVVSYIRIVGTRGAEELPEGVMAFSRYRDAIAFAKRQARKAIAIASARGTK